MAGRERPYFCSKPWTSFEINDHKGQVTPCCWSKVHCGNINDQSVEEIWNGPAFQAMRDHMRRGDLDPICEPWCPYRLGEHADLRYPEPATEPLRANLRLQREEMRQRVLVLRSTPTILNVCPSVTCNLDCVMCFQDRHDTAELPGDFDAILEGLLPTLQEIWVIGGEPLVSRECLAIIGRADPARFPDLHLGLITNGAAVSPTAEALLGSRRLSWLLVSIDAARPDTFRTIRRGRLDKVLQGVRALVRVRERQHAAWPLRIGFTVMRSNMDEMLEFADLARALGVECQYTPVFGDSVESFYADRAAVERALALVGRLEEHLDALGFDRIRAAPVRARLTLALDESAPAIAACAVSFAEWSAHLRARG